MLGKWFKGEDRHENYLDISLRGRAEWPGSFMKLLLSMALQKQSHSWTKLRFAMPPGMAMSLKRSLQTQSKSLSSNITRTWCGVCLRSVLFNCMWEMDKRGCAYQKGYWARQPFRAG